MQEDYLEWLLFHMDFIVSKLDFSCFWCLTELQRKVKIHLIGCSKRHNVYFKIIDQFLECTNHKLSFDILQAMFQRIFFSRHFRQCRQVKVSLFVAPAKIWGETMASKGQWNSSVSNMSDLVTHHWAAHHLLVQIPMHVRGAWPVMPYTRLYSVNLF